MQGRKGLLNGVASRTTRGKQKTIIPAYWHPEEIVDHNIGKLKKDSKKTVIVQNGTISQIM